LYRAFVEEFREEANPFSDRGLELRLYITKWLNDEVKSKNTVAELWIGYNIIPLLFDMESNIRAISREILG